MERILTFLKALSFWRFIALFTTLAILISEILMVAQSYWLYGEIRTDLMIVGFITPAIDAFLVFFIAAIILEQLKKQEVRQKETERYLRATLNNFPFFVWLKDDQSRFLTVNQFLAHAYERSDPTEIEGLSDFDLSPKEMAQQYQADDQEVMAQGTQKIVEEQVMQQGKLRWVETFKSPVYDSQGNITGTVGFARDISDRKVAEDALRRSERDHQTIFESVNAMVWYIDDNHQVRRINQRAADLCDTVPEEAIGKTVFELFPSDVARQYHNDNVEIMTTGEPKLGLIKPGQYYDGGPGWFRTDKVPYFDEQGRLAGITIMVTDVTEIKRTEQALREAKTQADQASQAKSDFLATMSHEIRTPMNAILGASEILAEGILSTEQKRTLHMLNTAGESLLQIISDILDISKIEAGRMELESISFYPYKMIHDLYGMMHLRAAEKGLQLLTHVDASVPRKLLGDPSRLRQILLNFTSNAIKFTHEGSVAILMRCQQRHHHQLTLIVTVVDTGIGIPLSKQNHIFEAFNQADTSMTRQYGGSGLGLAICQKLAKLMEGSITLHSQEEHGSSFTIAVPMHPAPHALSNQEKILQDKTVLIHHDHPIRHGYFENIVTQMGAVAHSHDNQMSVDQALSHRQKNHGQCPDLLLIHHDDVSFDALMNSLVRIREAHPSQKLPILICGDIPERSLVSDLQAMEVDLLLTPYNHDQLEENIQLTLERRLPPVTQDIPEHQTPLKLLVVDDSPDNLALIQAFLKPYPYQLVLAHDGAQALQRVTEASEPYNLVLMDVQMPIMDGYTATRKIRQWEVLEKRAPTPIIALTAHALSDHQKMSQQAGCDDHITKPIKKRGLLKAIKQHHNPTPQRPTFDLRL
ncbi:PAS domain-containing protein [Magnetococcus sp. PR-3]|uniref:PAS domain-containing protein n=1 Tax=Magnetococcus sp. PR-3 TaxID=3120355 RepID=UPI002FCE3BF4